MNTKKPASTTTKASSNNPDVAAKAAEKPSVYSAARKLRGAALKQAAKKTKKKSARKERPKKECKVKAIRKSFTMPQNEFQKISEIKKTCLKTGLAVKKSEVLRAGLKALCGMTDEQLKHAMAGLGKSKRAEQKS